MITISTYFGVSEFILTSVFCLLTFVFIISQTWSVR